MVFIAILLALALERFFDWGHLRRWQWFDGYCQMLSASIDRLSPALRLACWLLPPVLLVGLVEYILSGWIFGLFRLVFDFVILLYCFGPTNYWAQLYECLQAMQQGDAQLVDVRVKAAFPQVVAPTSQALHQTLARAIFIEGERRIFAVLFWFALCGPMGAVLYRLTVLANNRAITDMSLLSTQVLEVLDWLPARLLGFLFALGGHFVKVFSQWQKYATQGLNSSEIIIAETGLAALDLPANKPLPENGEVEKSAIQLFDRALIIMLVLSAVWVLLVS
jgi:membrane protein required for beta-lactamase induction